MLYSLHACSWGEIFQILTWDFSTMLLHGLHIWLWIVHMTRQQNKLNCIGSINETLSVKTVRSFITLYVICLERKTCLLSSYPRWGCMAFIVVSWCLCVKTMEMRRTQANWVWQSGCACSTRRWWVSEWPLVLARIATRRSLSRHLRFKQHRNSHRYLGLLRPF